VYRNLALVGMAMHVIPLTITCFAIPLAMGSNIWPIAGVFWCALAGPVGAVAGMLGGLLLRNANRVLAMTVLASTAALLSIAAGIVIWHNR
jgi:hypothetical protein